jgi:hypothetical protein
VGARRHTPSSRRSTPSSQAGPGRWALRLVGDAIDESLREQEGEREAEQAAAQQLEEVAAEEVEEVAAKDAPLPACVYLFNIVLNYDVLKHRMAALKFKISLKAAVFFFCW